MSGFIQAVLRFWVNRLHYADAGLILERVFTWIAVWRSSRGMK
jgi:hypothetical protein